MQRETKELRDVDDQIELHMPEDSYTVVGFQYVGESGDTVGVFGANGEDFDEEPLTVASPSGGVPVSSVHAHGLYVLVGVQAMLVDVVRIRKLIDDGTPNNAKIIARVNPIEYGGQS